jgi:phosphatidate cytidylyltransferase
MSEQNGPDGVGGVERTGFARLGSDFGTRLLWGIVMGVVAAAALFAGEIAFGLLVLVVAALMSWEWGTLVHGRGTDIVSVIHICTVVLAAGLAAGGYVGLGLLALPIGAILTTLLSLGRHSLLAAFGVFYIGLPAAALIWLRSDRTFGLQAVVFVILVVVATDTGAFLAGRYFGGPKLWARVSPNKTWAGLLGGLFASAVVGAAFAFFVPGADFSRLALTAVVLAVIAQLGDLMESAIKRRFGAKDASALIPGHGGVMDRVDGLVMAATVAGLIGFFTNVHVPAHALLLGY